MAVVGDGGCSVQINMVSFETLTHHDDAKRVFLPLAELVELLGPLVRVFARADHVDDESGVEAHSLRELAVEDLRKRVRRGRQCATKQW